MAHVYVQVRIPHRNQINADTVINTFHFTGVDSLGDMVTAILGRLTTFYNVTPGGGSAPLKNYWSGVIDPGAVRARFYDFDAPEPRAPIADESLGLVTSSPISTTNLPSETALCTSYRAALVSGENPARRRGRLYFGPLNAGASAGTGSNVVRPSTAVIGDLYRATRDLADASTLGARWVVWSRVNESAVPIEYGWVDNAFDTQRRRGEDATSRTNWSVEIP